MQETEKAIFAPEFDSKESFYLEDQKEKPEANVWRIADTFILKISPNSLLVKAV